MRNSLKDEKLLEKTTYTSMNCLQVFSIYFLILLFVSTVSSKLNFKHCACMQKYPSGNLGDTLPAATDLIYNNSFYLGPYFIEWHSSCVSNMASVQRVINSYDTSTIWIASPFIYIWYSSQKINNWQNVLEKELH